MILAIYLLGCVSAYILNRYETKKQFNSYSLEDRMFGLVFCLCSWVLFGVVLGITFHRYLKSLNINWDKEVKW